MKTDDLIAMLATGVEPVPAWPVARRLLPALGLGTLLALLLVWLELGFNPALPQMVGEPMFWVKLAFPAALGGAALLLMVRLGQPGRLLGASAWAGWLPFGAMAVLAAVVWLQAAPADRAGLVLGSTWQVCALNIAQVSIPLFIGLQWALRGLAPTRPALAGGVAGLAAGAAGCMVYALHCPELAAPFLWVWNSLGMAVPAAVGALLGPRLLRW